MSRQMWTSAEDQILIATHATCTVARQAAKLGRTLNSVRQRRARLQRQGLLPGTQRAYNRAWTDDEDAEAYALLAQGFSVPQVARRLKRTIGSIYDRQNILAARNQDGAQVRSANAAAQLLGVSQPTLVSWIDRGWLRATRNRASARRGRKSIRPEYLITDDAIMLFIANRETWPAWEAKWIADPDWRAYADEQRRDAGGRWMTTKEIAYQLRVASTTVLDWYQRGTMAGVATVVYQHRFFWSADIEHLPKGART